MRSHIGRGVLFAVILGSTAVAGAPFLRTEVRDPCGGRDPASYTPEERRPFFGELHLHTAYSIDAFVFNVRNYPHASYDFARGMPLPLTSLSPSPTIQLARPLDFAAVTDHAEGFGPAYICATPEATGNPPETTGYNSPECVAFRTSVGPTPRVSLLALIAAVGGPQPVEPTLCSEPGVDCAAAAASVWADEQAAAEGAYDRTSACRFTSFVAYEWTAMPGGANLHRNVIFRNERVTSKPVDYFETASAPATAPGEQAYDAARIWELLRERCLDRDGGELGVASGCDVLTIPHNTNLSAGMQFPDPGDTDVARTRQFFEPLVEITQHKGASECRWDPMFNAGTDTTDELCSFELLNDLTLIPIPGPSTPKPPDAFPRRSYIRNVLKDGLMLEESLGVDPFKLGIIGSTDTHYADAGNTEENGPDGNGYRGHVGSQDDTATKRVSDGGLIRVNPGGLAVVWAEENSRDSLFEAMRRRETYGTSGKRPIVRFFGGWSYPDDLCQRTTDLLTIAYGQGVPMGGDLPDRGAATAPRFFVSAMKDSLSGTPLQRIQIIKGWVQGDGTPTERVYDVDGGPSNATVNDDDGCTPTGDAGADQRCAVWTDPDFDPTHPAFYYARVVEDPTCRWHVRDCRSVGIDPLDTANCATQAVSAAAACEAAQTCQPGTNFGDCCRLSPTVQERAWTSPIWYEPRPAPPASCASLCGPAPAAGCRAPARSRGAFLGLTDATPDTRDQLLWRWFRGNSSPADFGDPLDSTSYGLCIYDGASNLVSTACAPAGGLCARRPCWKVRTGHGFSYRDKNRTPNGVDRMLLKADAAGKSKLLVKGRGTNLEMPHLPLTMPVKVQLKNTDGVCWEATYSAAQSNGPQKFRAAAD